MQAVTGVAFARAGLLGNPSDGYGGKALAIALSDFHAEVDIRPSDRLIIRPGESDMLAFDSLLEADARLAAVGCDDGLRLVRAALRRFCRERLDPAALERDDPRLRFEIGYRTDVPRQVGLSGSSAIVIATLRALSSWFGVRLAAAELAELALAAELEELGIAAGAMDRVVQAYQGAVVMDLAPPRSTDSYRTLDPALLPLLFIAWDPRGGADSGRAHGDLRARWLAGDRQVLAAVEAYRDLVDAGVAHLRAGDHDGFRGLMDENFEMRRRIFSVDDRDRGMVERARRVGAAAKLCGSGGAIVGSVGDEEVCDALGEDFRAAGFEFARPRVEPASEAGTVP